MFETIVIWYLLILMSITMAVAIWFMIALLVTLIEYEQRGGVVVWALTLPFIAVLGVWAIVRIWITMLGEGI